MDRASLDLFDVLLKDFETRVENYLYANANPRVLKFFREELGTFRSNVLSCTETVTKNELFIPKEEDQWTS